MTSSFEQRLRACADAEQFSGTLRVERAGQPTVEFAAGFADRANVRPNIANTRLAVASATKGFTALTIMSLIEDGQLTLDTTVRSIVGNRVPVIDETVTIDHLLTHRSGIGDYVDEEVLTDIDDHLLAGSSAHTFETPSDYLDLLNAYPQVTAPDIDFVYNNSGYVALSVIIETLTGSFHQAVHDHVLVPAGIEQGGFFRSDQLPADTALGYLANGRTNVFHLPVIGAGDGGLYLTLDDMTAFWLALFDGRIVSLEAVAAMTSIISARGDKPSYGRGFWLDSSGQHVWLEGMDAGVSFQSGTNSSTGLSYTVMSNTSTGVWPLVKLIVSGDAR